MKTSLENAINLYSQETRQAQKLRIDYILTDDKQENERIVICFA